LVSMNQESLQRANAFLAAVVERVAVGEVMTDTPAEIGRALGLPDALSTARAVRALIARRRLEPANGSYRLLDARPVDAGEKESIGRRPRRARGAAKPRGERAAGGSPGYSDLGRAVADKVVELGRENAQLRAEARQLREEARDARARMDEAERRARPSPTFVRSSRPRAAATSGPTLPSAMRRWPRSSVSSRARRPRRVVSHPAGRPKITRTRGPRPGTRCPSRAERPRPADARDYGSSPSSVR
jgi:hypothetical protein